MKTYINFVSTLPIAKKIHVHCRPSQEADIAAVVTSTTYYLGLKDGAYRIITSMVKDD